MSLKNEDTKERIYEYINEYITKNRTSPSVREIAKNANCAVSTAHKFLVRLEEEGYIDRQGIRHIVSTESSWEMGCLPVVGMIACGKPKLAVEDIQTYLPINKDYFGSGDYIGLIADGESMINAGIDSGDVVIVRKQPAAEEGQIVAAMVHNDYDNEMSATLKRFYRTDKENLFRLHPENDNMEDIYVSDIEIVGIAVRVLKNLERN